MSTDTRVNTVLCGTCPKAGGIILASLIYRTGPNRKLLKKKKQKKNGRKKEKSTKTPRSPNMSPTSSNNTGKPAPPRICSLYVGLLLSPDDVGYLRRQGWSESDRHTTTSTGSLGDNLRGKRAGRRALGPGNRPAAWPVCLSVVGCLRFSSCVSERRRDVAASNYAPRAALAPFPPDPHLPVSFSRYGDAVLTRFETRNVTS